MSIRLVVAKPSSIPSSVEATNDSDEGEEKRAFPRIIYSIVVNVVKKRSCSIHNLQIVVVLLFRNNLTDYLLLVS